MNDQVAMASSGALLPTFIVGPEHQGRGYKLLADSGVPSGDSWVVDLPMVLLEWAKLERQEPVAACIPVANGASIIFRARYFHRAALGPVAYIHGVYCDAEMLARMHWRTEWMVSAIDQVKEGLTFAATPLSITVAPPPTIEALWPGLGLAFANRLIIVEPELELDEQLVMALLSIDPPDHRRRISGWATTAELPTRGTIDPLRQCQLLLSRPPAPREAAERFLSRTVGPGRDEGPDAEPPPSRQMWLRFHAMLAQPPFGDPALIEAASWRFDYMFATPEAVAEAIARAVTRVVRAEMVLLLLVAMINDHDADINAAGRDVASQYLDALAAEGYLVGLIDQLLESAGADELVLMLFARLTPDAVARFEPDQFSKLLRAAEKMMPFSSNSDNNEILAALPNLANFVVQYMQKSKFPDLTIDLPYRILQVWPLDSGKVLIGIDWETKVKLIEGFTRLSTRKTLLAVTTLIVPNGLTCRSVAGVDDRSTWIRKFLLLTGPVQAASTARG